MPARLWGVGAHRRSPYPQCECVLAMCVSAFVTFVTIVTEIQVLSSRLRRLSLDNRHGSANARLTDKCNYKARTAPAGAL